MKNATNNDTQNKTWLTLSAATERALMEFQHHSDAEQRNEKHQGQKDSGKPAGNPAAVSVGHGIGADGLGG